MYCDNVRCQLERAMLTHQAKRRAMLNVVLICTMLWGIALGMLL
jgi:hypothetical protein